MGERRILLMLMMLIFSYFFPSEGRVKEGFAIFRIFFLLREGCVKGGFFRWEGKGEKEPLNFSFFEVQREGEGRMNEMPTYDSIR